MNSELELRELCEKFMRIYQPINPEHLLASALLSRLGDAKPKRDTWQPIETAPKDGTEFVSYNANQGGVKQLVSWNTLHGYWQSKGESIHLQATHYCLLPPAFTTPTRQRRSREKTHGQD